MTVFYIRRLFQMALVLLISAIATYTLLNFAPGGPLAGLRQIQQTGRFQITEDDIARIRAYFELDLYLPYRFMRWFVGWPTGPVEIGGREYFSDVVVGCRKPVETEVLNDDGEYEIQVTGCNELVYMKDLTGRRVSRGIIRGDFGLSWRLLRDRPVSELIISRLPKTIQLIGLSTLLSLFIGIPLGIYSAVKQYSRFDYIFTSLAFMGSAMPTFFFGIVMILLFSLIPKEAGWLYVPAGLSESVRGYTIPLLGEVAAGSVKDRILHLILPVAVLTIVNISYYSRFVRGSMLEVMRQDYIRTARAKGLLERVVIMKHALRNALIPFITIVVFTLPGLFSGAIITESIFAWPGMGRLYLLALGDYDYPVAMAIFFIIAVLTVIATLLRDVLYTIVDPRIRLS
ncbi:MAG: ABC transporter permease [Chloroflexi bacterium]|nr:ABC transporter permease [Anaerolineales bacterium]MCE7918385.1 ABC transporter permease [Chloroflexi bacterium CFX1]MCQ3951709.1 ABC transporter permease [Chloroflexota bacterium]MDL1917900.1 ABC transporter permease [Chloroflexi bacterium CFX5]MCK6569202.1 ABC transporter permease [Anaerolineales bacterium]